MVFNSISFLFFLPAVVILYYLLAFKYRWILIFVASCYFYMAFVPAYILILFFIILVDYFSGLLIERSNGRKRKRYLIISLLCNILLLFFFKYFNFANENLTEVLNLFGHHFHPINLNIILPIGLSFHTFQSMSYTIEVYRGKQIAEKHLGYFANYVLFFPQMVAGPIERYANLGNELRKENKISYNNLSDGFKLVLFGLLIKMTIADNIAPYVNEIYQEPSKYNALQVFSAMVLFAFQIYADFYGYSTIALGSARMLGINIMDNFKTPFASTSITEFWRRWHISLSSWFNDYVFTSFVTEKRDWGKWAVVIGLLLTFFLSGLWHGAGWNFAFYGLMHGVAIVFEFLTKKQRKKLATKIPNWLYLKVAGALTFLYVAFSWIFFRSENLIKTKAFITAMFCTNGNPIVAMNVVTPLLAVLGLILSDILLQNSRFDFRVKDLKSQYRWSIYALMIFCLMALSGTQKFNFIYFQF